MRLVSFIQSDDELINRKVIIFQFLKYLLKELTKESENQTTRMILHRLIIPSNFNVSLRNESGNGGGSGNSVLLARKVSGAGSSYLGSPTATNGRSFNEFDEIENSLLNSWIDRMNDCI